MRIQIPILFLCLSACTTTAVDSTPPAFDSTPPAAVEKASSPLPAHSVPGPASPSACLNIQDGDRHIEFNGASLRLGTEGAIKSLIVDDGDAVECLQLELVRGSKTPAVSIRYRTRESGTQVSLSDIKFGVAAVLTATWIVEPIRLERHFNGLNGSGSSGKETEVQNTVTWGESRGGKASLTIRHVESKASRSIVF